MSMLRLQIENVLRDSLYFSFIKAQDEHSFEMFGFKMAASSCFVKILFTFFPQFVSALSCDKVRGRKFLSSYFCSKFN
jgi:hypothetical protein